MTEAERHFAIQHLEASRDRALALMQSLAPEQRNFRCAPTEWTPHELVEHVILVEQLAHRVLDGMLKNGVPDETRRGKGAHKDRIILEIMPRRDTRVQAPPDFVPAGRWSSFDDLIAEFISARAESLEYARTARADLRVYFAPHPFLKDLDGYQWLILIGSHCERHMRQIEEGVAFTK